MSHVVAINVEYKDAESLKEAARILGLEVKEKSTYNWWGTHVGDYPLPEGFTAQDLGNCDFALAVPGSPSAYEVGVVKRRDGKEGFAFLYDFYGASGKMLEDVIGTGAERLQGGEFKQAYTVAATERSLQAKGYYTTREQDADGSLYVHAEVRR